MRNNLGSKRSAHSNAYLYGFWNNKRIVLYDTLLESYSPENKTEAENPEVETEQNANADKAEKSKPAVKKGCNDDEVVAVLGHEFGHWKLSHNMYNIVFSEVNF